MKGKKQLTFLYVFFVLGVVKMLKMNMYFTASVNKMIYKKKLAPIYILKE
jgi:hypothetical protein